VTDIIQMDEPANWNIIRKGSSRHRVATFSSSGKRFVIVVKKGNVERNTNEFSMLLYNTHSALSSHIPVVLLTRSSSSNRPAIQAVRWVDDRTIAFLGENPGETQQLYIVDCETKQTRQLTNHLTNVVSYAMDTTRGRFFFTAERYRNLLSDNQSSRNGIVISSQLLSDLIAIDGRRDSMWWDALDLYSQRRGERTEVQLITRGTIEGAPPIWPSPDGRYIVMNTDTNDPLPEEWKSYKYDDVFLRQAIRAHYERGAPRFLFQLELIDVDSGHSEPLLDAPTGSPQVDVAWSPDSRSVVVSRTFLPVGAGANERAARSAKRYAAEVDITTRAISTITDEPLKLHMWNDHSGRLLFESPGTSHSGELENTIIAYEKTDAGWSRGRALESELHDNDEVDVVLKEDMHSPPRIYVSRFDPTQAVVLLDLNPEFSHLAFGRIESVTYKAKDGHLVRAGIYFPPDFREGKRYPLVVQTHGWDPDLFWASGPYNTAYAAQPLAGKGFVVAQLEEDFSHLGTIDEVPEEVSAYEGVIDYLDERKLIDRNEVGIIGFSRTGLFVEYALTHSNYHFAAASLSDISDSGYFRYIALLNRPGFREELESMMGSSPFGAGLASWLQNSASFSLDKVRTPTRIEANGPVSLFFTWEWFAALSRLEKPVEFVYIPEGPHVLVKPWDRMISQQGNVDWFDFWLKGEEDSSPDKVEQYKRWRELRKLQDANSAQASH